MAHKHFGNHFPLLFGSLYGILNSMLSRANNQETILNSDLVRACIEAALESDSIG
ncbi:MAG: hypothetical protein WAM14_05005 [Candidatus Nitrosopolaris sp.]